MKPIWDLDNIDDLLAFVVQDLKDLGIKVPKPKKDKSSSELASQTHNKTNIFANFLCCLPCEYVKDCGHVPKFLLEAVEAIEPLACTEGIFRKSGALSRMKELKAQIENKEGFHDAQLVDVTSLLKLFFRELPEPLLTNRLCDTFLKCYSLSDERNAGEAIMLLCLLLPFEHLSTLRYFMLFLSRIASLSSVNKMDPTNLAIILSPSIMHMNNGAERSNSSDERQLQSQTAIVEFLIRSAPNIGMVTSSLIQRTELLVECYPTTKVSDISVQSTDSDIYVTKKKKRKRRSNSLQGFVSSIAQSISNWRTNHSTRSHNLSSDNGLSYSNESFNFIPNEVTTPQIRKRKASDDCQAFSSSKKQAILKQLPQNSVMANSSYLPQYPTLPRRIDIASNASTLRTSRKRLNLFSPKSSRKISTSAVSGCLR